MAISKMKNLANKAKAKGRVRTNPRFVATKKGSKKDAFSLLRVVIMAITMLTHRIVVVQKKPRRSANLLIDSYHLLEMIVGNTWLPDLPIPIADFKSLVSKYESALTAVKAKAPDAAAKAAQAKQNLLDAREMIRCYVQQVCMQNPAECEEIALGAGMHIKKSGSHNKQDFSATSSKTGQVELSSKIKAARCAHEWQCSLNPTDPASWYLKIIDPTLQGKTIADGFKPGTIVYLRHRSILKDGCTDWDQIISVQVAL